MANNLLPQRRTWWDRVTGAKNTSPINVSQEKRWGLSLFGFAPITRLDDKSGEAIKEGYCGNDAVYSIVRKIAKTASKAPFGVYKVKDETKYHQLRYAIKEGKKSTEISSLRYKAIEPVATHRLNRILNDPNDTMTGMELTESLISYRLLTGNSYVLNRYNASGQPIELHALPSHKMTIKADGMFPMGISGYRLDAGFIQEFTKDDIIHTKYFNPEYSITGAHLYGLSPLQAGWKILTGDNEGKLAAAEQMKNRGMRGVFMWENDKVNDEGARVVHDMVRDRLTKAADGEYKDAVFPMRGTGEYHRLGLSAADMQILELGKFSMKQLCNIYGVSDILFNGDGNAKYSNYQEAREELITNAVLPELTSLRDAYSRRFREQKALKDNEVIDYDPTVYQELEGSKKELVEWMDKAPLSPDEQRIYLGEQPLGTPEMQKVYISRNKVPIELAGTVNPTPDNGNAV